METLLKYFILVPIAGFLFSLFLPQKKETLISWSAFFIVGLHFAGLIAFFIYWLVNKHPSLDVKELSVFKTDDYEFYIDLCFDKISAVYLLVGGLLTFLVTVYSRYYLHRESGYKRFFNTILFFYVGYNVAVLSGNIETLFAGWEILGISSFLLIAFYRERYLPVRNAMKVFTVYRIGDAGLILAMWLSHHFWHENITFAKLNNFGLVHTQIEHHVVMGLFISAMFIVAAAAKSAQLPFSSWLPRAMEGPTPSSAIFYGSLSVHLGVFILLRTFPFWQHQISIRILVAVLGLATSVVATLTARVQSSVKSQIAYSSIAQIGLIFIEVAAGFEKFALFHFAGNAFLRTYQLLVSPSAVAYLIREQFYNFVPRQKKYKDWIPKKLEYSLYVLSLKEWNLDRFVYLFFMKPLSGIGKLLSFLNVKTAVILFVVVFGAGLFCLFKHSAIPESIDEYLPATFSLIALIMVLKSYTERKSIYLSWILIIMSHFCIALAVSLNAETAGMNQTFIYLSGVVVAGIIGALCIGKLKALDNNLNLNQFHGYSYEYKDTALVFLLACLGLGGFPITPTFLGEDIMFSHIDADEAPMVFFVVSSFIATGLSLIRMYSRIFLGPYVKSFHEMAFRSS